MTTWTYGGTALTSFGRVTLIDDYLDIPQRRGDNITIPYRHGAKFAEKFYDQRKMLFGIAVISTSAQGLETLFDTMKTLFSPRTLQTLACTREDSTVRNISASVDSPLNIQRVSDKIAKVVVEFTCPDPIFRLSTAIADNTLTINASPKAMTVTNPGSVEERDPTITIAGPFTSITLTNSTNGAVLTYIGAIDAGETVTIGTLNGEYYATHNVDGNVIGNVTHSGSSALMVFNAGANTLAITSAGGDNSGTVKASFFAPFL